MITTNKSRRSSCFSRLGFVGVLLAMMGALEINVTAQVPPVAQPLAPRNISPSATKPGVTVSANKQFVIHGADLNTRGAFSMMSEETARSLGALLRDDARYTIPVVVVLKTPPDVDTVDPTVKAHVDQLVPSGFHLQMNVQLRPDFRTEDYTRELVRVLLAERILRNHEQLKTSRQRVLPDWTLTGIMQALEFRSRTKPSTVFMAVFRSGQIYSVDRILAADPAGLDALSRTIFETSSCALVLSLLDQPEGALRFSHFLSSLATGEQSDRELLEHYFPGLGVSKNSMEKWWTLQLASLATPTALETMSVNDTEEALDQALTLRFKKEKVEKEEPAKPVEEPKKETGGVFRFFGSKKKDAPVEDKKLEEKSKTEEKPKAEVEKAKPKEKAQEPEKKKEEAKPDDEEKKPFFQLPNVTNPFSRKIFFPFSKKKSEDADESDSAKEEADKPKKKEDEKKKTADKPAKKDAEAKAEKPQDKKAPEPAKKSREEIAKPASPITEPAKIPAKKSSTRGVSGRPADLKEEKAQPATKPAEPKKEEPKKEEKPDDVHRSMLNPINWFRKSTPPPTAGSIALEKLKAGTEKPVEAPKKIVQGGLPVEDFKQIWKREDRTEILKNSLQQLNALKLRAHPLYKNLINDYADVLDQLAHGKDRGAMDKLEKLREQRNKIHEGAAAVESYLDWYEASQVQSFSGAFDDYLKLCRKLDDEVHTRTDALSKYLDAVEKEFE